MVKEVEVFDPISENVDDDYNETNSVTEADISKAATDEADSVVIESVIRNVNTQTSQIQSNDFCSEFFLSNTRSFIRRV